MKLPRTYFTEDRRHVEVMGLLTAWMKHDRRAKSINYPEVFFFLFLSFFSKGQGSLLAMRSLRSQSRSEGALGREHVRAWKDFNNAATTRELPAGERTHMELFHHLPPVRVRLNDFPDVQN